MQAGRRVIDGVAVLVAATALMALTGPLLDAPAWASWGAGRSVMPSISGLMLLVLAALLWATEHFLALEIGVEVTGRADALAIRLRPAKHRVAWLPKYLIRSLAIAGLLVVVLIAGLAGSPGSSGGLTLPPPHTILCLGLLFFAAIAATYQRVSALIIMQVAGMVVMIIAASAVIGHLFGTRSPVLMGFSASRGAVGMALPTAVCLLALGGGVMAYAGRDFFIAVPVRRFLAFRAVALLMVSLSAGPVLLGWLIATWGWSDRYGRDSALAMLVVLNGFLQLPVILHVARKLFFHEYQLKQTAESLRITLAEKEELAEKLRLMTLRDALTGLGNRRAFEEELDKVWRRCQRAHAPVALLFVDIDHFKRYNDHYGHPAGDACLAVIARLLAETAGRAGDLAARLGGEEFVLLLPDTTAEGAMHLAARLHERLQASAPAHAASGVADRVTVSVGAACCQPVPGLSPQSLLEAADKALYEAKNRGRNRTFVAPANGKAA